jgi:hypothetical protein
LNLHYKTFILEDVTSKVMGIQKNSNSRSLENFYYILKMRFRLLHSPNRPEALQPRPRRATAPGKPRFLTVVCILFRRGREEHGLKTLKTRGFFCYVSDP